MKRPDFLQPLTADIGRVGDRGANILALIRYVTAHTEETDGRKRLDDGEMWWRATREDIGDSLGGVSEKSVGGALRKLQDAGELLAKPAKSFHGDRANMYRVPNMPPQGSDVPSDENGTGSDLPSDENVPPIGRNRPTPWDENVPPPGTKSSDLPSIEELEEGEKKARTAESEPLDAEAVPDPANALPTEASPKASETATSKMAPWVRGPYGPRCRKHVNLPDPPKCHGCRNAREADEAEQAAAADRSRVERQARRDAIVDCPDCDEYGQIDHGEAGVANCQHPNLSPVAGDQESA